MEEERVRVRENLANWLLQNINKGCGFKDMTFGQAATQILNQEGIRIEADDQRQPEFLTLGNISGLELVNETRKSMLKPDSEGNVWVKVRPKKE